MLWTRLYKVVLANWGVCSAQMLLKGCNLASLPDLARNALLSQNPPRFG